MEDLKPEFQSIVKIEEIKEEPEEEQSPTPSVSHTESGESGQQLWMPPFIKQEVLHENVNEREETSEEEEILTGGVAESLEGVGESAAGEEVSPVEVLNVVTLEEPCVHEAPAPGPSGEIPSNNVNSCETVRSGPSGEVTPSAGYRFNRKPKLKGSTLGYQFLKQKQNLQLEKEKLLLRKREFKEEKLEFEKKMKEVKWEFEKKQKIERWELEKRERQERMELDTKERELRLAMDKKIEKRRMDMPQENAGIYNVLAAQQALLLELVKGMNQQ